MSQGGSVGCCGHVLVRVLGVVGALFVVLSAYVMVKTLLSGEEPAPDGSYHAVAMELPLDIAEFQGLTHQPDEVRDELCGDDFLGIPLYTLFLGGLGLLLVFAGRHPVLRALGALAVLVVASAAVADWRENNLIREAMSQGAGLVDEGLADLERTALFKWVAFYVAVGLGSLAFLRVPRLGARIAGGLLLAAGAVGLFVLDRRVAAQCGLYPLLLGVGFGAILLLLRPERLIGGPGRGETPAPATRLS